MRLYMKYTRKMFMISAALTAAVSLSQVSLSLAAQKDDIAAARIQYNSNATSYNTKISSFPSNFS